MGHDPTEHVQEEIHHHAQHSTERWIAGAALTAALLAVLAAVGGALASAHLTESSRHQIESNDKWGFYQAKSIKSSILKAKDEMLVALGKEPSEKDKAKIEEYEKEMKETKVEADELVVESRKHLHMHEVIERGVTFFHIAIAVVAIAVLTKRKPFWFLSLGFGVVGLFFLVQAFLPAGH
ncbi:MAG: DUF4337 family protein [Planctomycetota bacterium]|nr:DUF4337 family protein [Planctomycetota bacterium]